MTKPIAVLLTAGFLFVGCKRSPRSNAGATSEPKEKVSVDSLIAKPAGAEESPPAPDAPGAPPPPPVTFQEPANQGQTATSTKEGAGSGDAAESWSSTDKFQRNSQWLRMISSGDPEQKKQGLAEIQKARLSAQEMRALQQMAQHYGVKF